MSCENCREYEVIFKFADIKKLTKFMEYVSQFDNKQEPKVEKRGSQTAELHRLTKQFHQEHPQYTYHEAMRLCRQIGGLRVV